MKDEIKHGETPAALTAGLYNGDVDVRSGDAPDARQTPLTGPRDTAPDRKSLSETVRWWFCCGGRCEGKLWPASRGMPHPITCLAEGSRRFALLEESDEQSNAQARKVGDVFTDDHLGDGDESAPPAAPLLTITAVCGKCGAAPPVLQRFACSRCGEPRTPPACCDDHDGPPVQSRVAEAVDLIRDGQLSGGQPVDPGKMVALLMRLGQVADEKSLEAIARALTDQLAGRGRVGPLATGPSARVDAFALLPRTLHALMCDAYAAGFAAAGVSEQLRANMRGAQ